MRISDWSSDVCSSDLVSRFSELVRLGGEADYHGALADVDHAGQAHHALEHLDVVRAAGVAQGGVAGQGAHFVEFAAVANRDGRGQQAGVEDRKSTRLNSSH